MTTQPDSSCTQLASRRLLQRTPRLGAAPRCLVWRLGRGLRRTSGSAVAGRGMLALLRRRVAPRALLDGSRRVNQPWGDKPSPKWLHHFATLAARGVNTRCTAVVISPATFRRRPVGRLGAASFRRRTGTATAAVPQLTLTAEGSTTKVATWILGCGATVFGMVVLGGVTRLTHSGLSMTEWRLQGTWPPTTAEAWEVEFAKYRRSPEFYMLHPDMVSGAQ